MGEKPLFYWKVSFGGREYTTISAYQDSAHFYSNVYENEGVIFVWGENEKPVMFRASEIVSAREWEERKEINNGKN